MTPAESLNAMWNRGELTSILSAGKPNPAS